ncbi:hypothetical protein [Schlesneria sp. DSM 10557]|uniref:hypothetical protein n=1 Tax=Schlesneria sp. DSM 10557 TaxID=3044399 RepID=UPI0035A0EA9E
MMIRNSLLLLCRLQRCLLLGSLLLVPAASRADESKSAPLPKGLLLKQPVMPDSLNDTMRSVNERLSQDVAPSDNAAVLLVQVCGEDVFDPVLKADSLAMLGIASLAPSPAPFVYFQQFADSLGPDEKATLGHDLDTLPLHLATAIVRPWKQDEYPSLVAFLNANRQSLDILVEASRKPKYYAPVLSEADPPQLLSMSVTLERRLPFLVRCLSARAMLRVTEQKGDQAIEDLVACQRLAVLLATGSPFDVSAIKAHQMEGVAFQASTTVLQAGGFTGAEAKNYLAKLKEIKPLPPAAIAADVGERAVLRRQIELLKLEDSTLGAFFEFPDTAKFPKLEQLRLSVADWDQVFARANEVQDEVVKALSTKERDVQSQLFTALDEAYAAWDEQNAANRITTEDLKKLSRFIGETMAMSLRPRYRQLRQLDDRAQLRRDLLLLSLSVVSYRADHQAYPATLADLTPDYLEIVPRDANGEPFRYDRLSAGGVRLVSLGSNLENDAGLSFNDDIVIALP